MYFSHFVIFNFQLLYSFITKDKNSEKLRLRMVGMSIKVWDQRKETK